MRLRTKQKHNKLRPIMKQPSKTMVIALRPLLPTLTSPNQKAFKPGQMISDNTRMVQDLMETLTTLTGKDYAYAVTPLLEDALMDRDLVHRQTAAVTVKHLALGCAGLGCEDAVMHLLNFVWPNIFETSPHVINAVMDAIEGCRVALGSGVLLSYTLQGLFHPARKVRETYWKLYNNAYIGGQEALVPHYPAMRDEGENAYKRHELDVFL